MHRLIKPLPLAILVLYGILLAISAIQNCVVVSEVNHLPAGLSHLCLNHFDLLRVNPPLVRMVAAIPVLADAPALDWSNYSDSPLMRAELKVGQDFLKANGSKSLWYFTLARWACIPFSIIGAYICLRWGRELYGEIAGLLALSLWCFCPFVLGHAALITPDAHAATMAVGSGYVFWRWLCKPFWDSAILAGLVLGLAELCKLTLLVFYPLWLVTWLGLRLTEWRKMDGPQWLRETGQLASAIGFSILVINIGYGFEDSFQPLGKYRFQTRTMTGIGDLANIPAGGGNRFATSWLSVIPAPVPANYLQGIDAQKLDFERGMRSYLHGEWKMGGWWYYYLYAMAIKIPLGMWGLLIIAVVVTLFGREYSVSWRDELVLLLPAATILILISSQSGFSIHSRYVLPMLPFVFVWISKVGRCIQLQHWTIAAVAGMALGWSVGSSLWYYPHSLSYFNELVGGPMGGHAHLLDSNIAWGQDLYFLKRWYDNHPDARPLHLAYYGLIDPRLVGIEFVLPPVGPASGNLQSTRPSIREMGPLPGWYAIDMNHLHGANFTTADGQGAWQSMSGDGYDLTYFQRFQPIATAGYSIYIYHITENEANQVRKKLGLPELPKDWRPVEATEHSIL